ncbi:MAG: SDR family NAD(P)-dependent oxidoreductase [Dongiaceae bacterium]
MTKRGKGTVLITGASAGIGAALARLMAGEGFDVALTARRRDRLDALAKEVSARGVNAHVWPDDLADPAAPRRLHDRAKAEGVEIAILVNNAGFGARGSFTDVPLERQLEMIAVNVTALTSLTHLFLQDMKARGHGRILNVASMAGFQPGPFLAVYYATKGYDYLFTEALAEELNGSGITACCLFPGVTDTEWHAVAGTAGTMLSRMTGMSAEAVARIAYDGLMTGRRSIIPGLQNKASALVIKVAPRRLLTYIVGRLQSQR